MREQARDHCEARIREAEVRREPFPHIEVEPLFPPDFYQELMEQFPARRLFQKAEYAGTGFSRREAHYVDYGLALPAEELAGPYAEVVAYMQSEVFARLLLEKFGDAIPARKQSWFAEGSKDYGSRCHVHIDLPGYEIPPHPDAEDKLITYQLYLPPDESVREFGTHFLRPKDGNETVERPVWELLVSRGLEKAARGMGWWEKGWVKRLRESEFGFRHGLLTRMWYPWDWFDTVRMVEARPNSFMAFAPSERTYHAVRLDIPANHPRPERPVIRGFVRRGAKPFDRVAFRG